MKKVYDGWKYPADWIVEGFAQEGPKILRHGDYYYMVLAEGGTAGPPTGHMIVAARSRTIEGPWENSPYNPIVRTTNAADRWWSKGHGTLIDDRAGRWWMVYHAYENGFYTLGRQTLLEPIEWLPDGWFRTAGADPAMPIVKPAGENGTHGFPLSDDFSTSKMGVQWSFYNGDASDRDRYRYANGTLVLKAKGKGPADSSPLWFVNGDQSYEIEVDIDADPDATAGLLLFYSRRLYAGLGFSSKNLIMHSYGLDRPGAKPSHIGGRLHHPTQKRSPHRHHVLQRGWDDVGAVRSGDRSLGVSPQRRVRLPEPPAGAVRRRHGRGAIPQLPISGDSLEVRLDRRSTAAVCSTDRCDSIVSVNAHRVARGFQTTRRTADFLRGGQEQVPLDQPGVVRACDARACGPRVQAKMMVVATR